VQGPIVIHGPADYVEYDADLGVIQVTDWFHDTYDYLVDLVLTPTNTGLPYRPFSDSNLVAGVGQYPCANVTNGAPCSVPAYASWKFEQGKTYRLRFVNTGASAFETISIDGHTLTVIANDFVPVQPYQTQYITLGVGQRTDVLVTASAAPGSYWLRAYNQPQCGDSSGPDGRGIIYYSGIDPKTTPTDTTGSTPPPVNVHCQNDALASTMPMYAIAAAEPDTTITLTISGSPNTTGAFHWTFNDVAYNGNLDAPLLFDAVQSSTSSSSSATTLTFAPTSNVYNIGTNGTVRIIVYNTLPAPHPMHLHGHDFQVLAEGSGVWDGTIVNPANPQRRDVHMSWSGANASDPAVGSNYMVLQFEADNAGLWPFHCHIAWHLSAGMAVMILERPDEVAELEIPAAVTATCDLFKSWQATNPTPDVDDGLKKKKRETLAKRMVDYMKGAGGEHVVRHVDKHRKRGVRGWGHVHEREL
jgi:FtsP/CotA-like multicopper oxidase with cupredoxin domain